MDESLPVKFAVLIVAFVVVCVWFDWAVRERKVTEVGQRTDEIKNALLPGFFLWGGAVFIITLISIITELVPPW